MPLPRAEGKSASGERAAQAAQETTCLCGSPAPARFRAAQFSDARGKPSPGPGCETCFRTQTAPPVKAVCPTRRERPLAAPGAQARKARKTEPGHYAATVPSGPRCPAMPTRGRPQKVRAPTAAGRGCPRMVATHLRETTTAAGPAFPEHAPVRTPERRRSIATRDVRGTAPARDASTRPVRPATRGGCHTPVTPRI